MSLFDLDDIDVEAPKQLDSKTVADSQNGDASASSAKPNSAGGWKSAVKLLAPVRRKNVPAPIVARPKVTAKPVVSLDDNKTAISSNFSHPVRPTESFPLLLQKKKPSKKSKREPVNIHEDYDPVKPNEYEFCKAEAKRRKHEEKLKKSRFPELEGDARSEDERYSEDSMDGEPMVMAPPVQAPSTRFEDTSGEEAYRRRMQLSAPVLQDDKTGDDAYRRRMILSQGSASNTLPSAPGTLETGDDNGDNMDEDDEDLDGVPFSKPEDDEDEDLDGVPLMKASEPSTVVLLRNLVGPGEVDADLEGETASECSKYGKVEKCLIYEVTNGEILDNEAVRVFVKFADKQSALNAKSKMDNRFFGGRIISAVFFDEDRFQRSDLAPSLHSVE